MQNLGLKFARYWHETPFRSSQGHKRDTMKTFVAIAAAFYLGLFGFSDNLAQDESLWFEPSKSEFNGCDLLKL